MNSYPLLSAGVTSPKASPGVRREEGHGPSDETGNGTANPL